MSASEIVTTKVVTPEHIPARVANRLKPWQARYIGYRLKGMEPHEARKRAGLPDYWRGDRSPERDPVVATAIDECTALLAESALAVGLADAAELHENLTEELRGDIAELYDDVGELKPIKDWPMWARQGGVEVLDEPNMVHSADGGGGSWDQVGRRIKIRAGSRHKAKELLAKLKVVDAMVAQKDAGSVNVLIVNAETARKVVGARKRLERVIETVPESGHTTGSNSAVLDGQITVKTEEKA